MQKVISFVLVIAMFVTNVPFKFIETAEVSALTNTDIKLPEVSGSTRIDTDPTDGISGDYVIIQNTGTTTQSSGNLEGIVTSSVSNISHYPDLDELDLLGYGESTMCGSMDLPIEEYKEDSFIDKITSLFTSTPTYNIDETRTFYLSDYSQNTAGDKTFVLKGKTNDAYIWVEEGDTSGANEIAQDVANEFDDYYNNILVPNFGEFYDKDGSGMVNILIYSFENTSASGFFYSGDYSLNNTQMVHLSNKRYTTSMTLTEILSTTLVHEIQHLINYGYCNIINRYGTMSTWLNEGLSMAAEEMVAPGNEISGRVYSYLLDSGNEIVNGKPVIDWTQNLNSYAMSCLFTSYLDSQVDSTVFSRIYDNYTGNESDAIFDALIGTDLEGYDFYDILLAFQLAITMNDSGGFYGYNSNTYVDSIAPHIYTTSNADIPAGGSIVIELEEGAIFNTETTGVGEDIRFIGVIQVDESERPIIIDKPEEYLVIGEQHQLDLDFNGVTDNIVWSSSNENIATISSNGLLNAIGIGTIVITAKDSTTNISDSFLLVVCDKTIYIEDMFRVVAEGESITIIAVTRPEAEVIWSIDDPTIANIDSNGIVMGISSGSAIITAKYSGSDNIITSCEINVVDELYPGLVVNFEEKTIDVIADIGMDTLGRMTYGEFSTYSNHTFDNSLTDVTINQMTDLTLVNHSPIGTHDDQFAGTFNGNGFSIYIKSLNEIYFSQTTELRNTWCASIFGYNKGFINDVNIIVTEKTTIEVEKTGYFALLCLVNYGEINFLNITIEDESKILSSAHIALGVFINENKITQPNVLVTGSSLVQSTGLSVLGFHYSNAGVIESPSLILEQNSSFKAYTSTCGLGGNYGILNSPTVIIQENSSLISYLTSSGIGTNSSGGVIQNATLILRNNSTIESGYSVGGIASTNYGIIDTTTVIICDNSHIIGTLKYTNPLGGVGGIIGKIDSNYTELATLIGNQYIYISEGSTIQNNDTSYTDADNCHVGGLIGCLGLWGVDDSSVSTALIGKNSPTDEMKITVELYGTIQNNTVNNEVGGGAGALFGYTTNSNEYNNNFGVPDELLPEVTVLLGVNGEVLNGDNTKGVLFYNDLIGNNIEYTSSRDKFVYAVPYDSDYKGFAVDDSTSNRIEYPYEKIPTTTIGINENAINTVNSNNDGVFIKANGLENKDLIFDTNINNYYFDLTEDTIATQYELDTDYYKLDLIADGVSINVPAYLSPKGDEILQSSVVIDGISPTIVYPSHFDASSNKVSDNQTIKIYSIEGDITDWNVYRIENLYDILSFNYEDVYSIKDGITLSTDDDMEKQFNVSDEGLYVFTAKATSSIDSSVVEDIKYIYIGEGIQIPVEPLPLPDLEFTIEGTDSTTIYTTEEQANTNAVATGTTQSVEIFADNGSITSWALYKDGKNITDDITYDEDKQVETHSIEFSVTDDGLYKVVGTGVSLYDEDDTSTITKYFTINEPTPDLVLDISATCTLYDTENSVVSVEGDQSVTITATNGYIDDFTVYRNNTEITVEFNAILDSDDRFTTLQFTVSDDGVYKVVANAKSDNGQTATDTQYLKIENTPLTPIITLSIAGSNIESTSSSAESNPATSTTAVTISATNDNIDTWTVTKNGSDITSSLVLTTDTDLVKIFALVDDGLYVITATTDSGVTSTRYLCIENPVAPTVSLSISGSNVESTSSSAESNPATSTTAVTISSSNDEIDTWTVTKDGTDITSSLSLNYDTTKLKVFNLTDDGLYVITATTTTGVTSTKYLSIETPVTPTVTLSITGSNVTSTQTSAESNPATSSTTVTISASNDNIDSYTITKDGSDITSSITLTSDTDTLKVFTLTSDGLYTITATTDTGVTTTSYLYIETPTTTPTISLNISGDNVYTSQSTAESNPATSSRIVTITSTNDDIYTWSISRNGTDITDSVTIYTNNSDEKILYVSQSGLYEITATTDGGSISSTKYLYITSVTYTNPFLDIQGRHVMFTENEALNNPTETRETVVVFCENGYINDVNVYLNNNLVNINYEQNNSNYKVFSLSNPGLYTINASATSNTTVSIATETEGLIRDLSIKPLSFINLTSSTPTTMSRTKYLCITDPIIVTPPVVNDYVSVTYLAETGGAINGYTFQNILRFTNTNIVTAVAMDGYEFVSWSDGLTTPTRIDYSVSSDMTIYAIFKSIGGLAVAPQTGSNLVIGIYVFMITLLGAIAGASVLIYKVNKRNRTRRK